MSQVRCRSWAVDAWPQIRSLFSDMWWRVCYTTNRSHFWQWWITLHGNFTMNMCAPLIQTSHFFANNSKQGKVKIIQDEFLSIHFMLIPPRVFLSFIYLYSTFHSQSLKKVAWPQSHFILKMILQDGLPLNVNQCIKGIKQLLRLHGDLNLN